MDKEVGALKAGEHGWKFFRAGGFDQVRLDEGGDLKHLDQLDQKLWVALSCPTRGLEFDPGTLDLIDADHDGRIRAPEILAAVKWACLMVKDAGQLLKGTEALPLSAISEEGEGKTLLSSAKQILINLGKRDAESISVEDTTDTERIFAQTLFNGDGIIPKDAAEGEEVQKVIGEIMEVMGVETDRSGKPGIGQKKVDDFFGAAAAYSAWWAQAEGDGGRVLPLGEGTMMAVGALGTVRGKIEDYFARCRLAAFDARAQAALNRQESEYLAIAAKDLKITAEEVVGFPLARVEAGKALPLKEGLNPAWTEGMKKFTALVIEPVLGKREVLTEAEWGEIMEKFSAFDLWSAQKAGGSVEKLGLERLREILAGDSRAKITALIDQDVALEPEATAISMVDRLVRFNRDLCKLLNNFVCFRDFYSHRAKAVFQAGTLYLDQRSCDLCVRVEDAGKHASMALLSRTYLAYCELARRKTGEKMMVAAAFTAGDSDNLMVGRNGIFYDRNGEDWDATIVRIIDNPISIRQAFWAPYKRVLRWIEEQVVKRAAAADASATDNLTSSATNLENAATAPLMATPPPPPPKMKIDVGVVAALGVAVGGIAAAFGAILQSFFGLGVWMPLGLVALVFLISGPSMVIAWLKLRQRNLGPILDANGWAVNAKAKINIPFGGSLTATAKLPAGSKRDLHDPYAQKTHGKSWTALAVTVIIAVAVVWVLVHFGFVEKWTARLRSSDAPSTQPATRPE